MDQRINLWIRFLLPLFLTLFLGTLIYMMAQFREAPEVTWYALIWFTSSIFIIWEGGWWISKKLDRSFPWQNGSIKRLAIQLLLTNLLGISFFLGSYILLNWYENAWLGHQNPLGLLHILVSIAEGFIIVQITNSVQIGYQLLHNWQAVRLEAEQLKKENALTKLEQVRQQIDPLFLEHQFNQLSTLIKDTPEQVSERLKELSNHYQDKQSLLASGLIHVQQELEISDSEKSQKDLNSKAKDTSYKSRFLVKSGHRFFLIPTADIAVIYKDEIVLIFTRNGKKYPFDHSLEEAMDLLNPQQFFRINRQQIIQASFLDEMRMENNQLLLSLKLNFPKTLTVSQRNVPTFKKWLKET